MKKLLLSLMLLAGFSSADTGDIPLSSNFQVNSPRPLDARTTVDDSTARDAIAAINRYDGLTVYQRDDSTMWQLQGGTSTWVDVTAGGGGGMTPGASYYVQVDPVSQQAGAFNISSGAVSSLTTSSVSINSGYLSDALSLFSTKRTLGITYDSYYNHAQLNSSLGVGLGGYYFIAGSTGTTFDPGASGGLIRMDASGILVGYGNIAGNAITNGFAFVNGSQAISGPLTAQNLLTASGGIISTTATVSSTSLPQIMVNNPSFAGLFNADIGFSFNNTPGLPPPGSQIILQ